MIANSSFNGAASFGMAPSYTPVLDNDDEELKEQQDERQSFIPQPPAHSGKVGVLRSVAIFLSGALLPVIILLALFLENQQLGVKIQLLEANNKLLEANAQANNLFGKEFKEDALLPSDRIQLERRRFTTPVDFNVTDGVEFLVVEPNEVMYVGEPSPEIDRAWRNLLWGRYFSISEDEAKMLWGNDYMQYADHDRTGFTGGFDMFHQLHCLNQIRQALRRDYYPETLIHGEVHLEHCINHLRQGIQCRGDIDITPIKYFPGYEGGHGYVYTHLEHTCRKFEPIRNYVTERTNGSLVVPRPGGKNSQGHNSYDPEGN